jgi:hypothetical protein
MQTSHFCVRSDRLAKIAHPRQSGGSARAYLVRLTRRQRSYRQGFHSRMACVARIFIQATLRRERPLLPLRGWLGGQGVAPAARFLIMWWRQS